MTMMFESEAEEAALCWLQDIGYLVAYGPEIAPGELAAERDRYSEVLLHRRLRAALTRLNPEVPAAALEEALRKVATPASPSLVENNRAFHRMLVDGVEVEYNRPDGTIAGEAVRLVDWANPAANDWLAVNQFTVEEGQRNRRPDVVLFVNGLPLAVIELKNPAGEEATVWKAFNQLQTYKAQIPSLFVYNEALVVSDGLNARIGALTANTEWFMPWRTVAGEALAPDAVPQLEVLLKGVFAKRRFLDLVRHFNVFEDNGEIVKKLAGYHQFHAARRAVETTIEASSPSGDRRCGVVWHTQGSGKSLTMAFFAGKLILEPAMKNPTIVVLTDRNDLDDQLFGTFCACQELLRQAPQQAECRGHLRELLRVVAGGVVFTTVHKFLPDQKGDRYPLLSDRQNIVVIADEAHRSQYDFVDGFARHLRDALPNASFIAFTGTPIELADRSTPQVFGDYIDIYDMQQAVEDKATVPIYYESRLAELDLDESQKPHLDPDFEEVTEGEELESKEKLKTKWAALEAVVGSDRRLALIAEDLVNHFEQRLEAMEGKAMVVCMSRRICVELYDEIVRLRPEWHHPDDDQGQIKVVMTGSASDPASYRPHVRTKGQREALANRFKDERDPFKIAIVRDMWLTGFDVPPLHTMYVDKPMRGHGLMQAIARVNRVFKDKPGGLVVDYLGLAAQLRDALTEYTRSGGRGKTALDQEQAVDVMLARYEICRALFHGFDWSAWTTGTPEQRLTLLAAAQQHIFAQEDGKNRLLRIVTELSQAFALSVPHAATSRIHDDVAFFQAVRSAVAKTTASGQKPPDELDHAIRQLVSKAISPDGVIDVFEAAGLKKPDISILSEEFLAEVQAMPYQDLAVQLLQRLLNDEIKVRSRRNLVQSRSFAEMLEHSINAYRNRALTSAQVIEALIDLARDIREADRRGAELGLDEDELAFYDALETNDSAVAVLGDETLKQIARELVKAVQGSVTIDWTLKENVQAKMRVMIKRILRRHGYPPDKQKKATETVMQQAELLCADWT